MKTWEVRVEFLKRSGTVGRRARAVVLPHERGTSPYLARIRGTHATYRWDRAFVKLETVRELRVDDVTDRAYAWLDEVGALPAMFDANWGPDVAAARRRAGLRGYFYVTDCEPFIAAVDEVDVHRFVFDRTAPALPAAVVARPVGARAPIIFGEEA